MSGWLEKFANGRRLLLVVAAPAEARAVLSGLGAAGRLAEVPWVLHGAGRFDVVVSGVGKANAAAAVARLADPARHAAVLSVGVAGALPAPASGAPVALGTAVAASACVYADEGLQGPDGFIDCARMGFPLGPFEGSAVPVEAGLLAALRPALGDGGVVGPVATVSTCSGLDALAAEVARRTGAIAEAMEGAAVAHVAARLGITAGEVRIISNTTGDRTRQRWDLPGALRVLEEVVARL